MTKKLPDAVIEYYNRILFTAKDWGECAAHKAVRRAGYFLKETKGYMMEWISVKDRLPENKNKCGQFVVNEYLVTDGNSYEIKFWDGKNWINQYDTLEYQGYTHWLPLPEPPKD